jgi:hypothetical protein
MRHNAPRPRSRRHLRLLPSSGNSRYNLSPQHQRNLLGRRRLLNRLLLLLEVLLISLLFKLLLMHRSPSSLHRLPTPQPGTVGVDR